MKDCLWPFEQNSPSIPGYIPVAFKFTGRDPKISKPFFQKGATLSAVKRPFVLVFLGPFRLLRGILCTLFSTSAESDPIECLGFASFITPEMASTCAVMESLLRTFEFAFQGISCQRQELPRHSPTYDEKTLSHVRSLSKESKKNDSLSGFPETLQMVESSDLAFPPEHWPNMQDSSSCAFKTSLETWASLSLLKLQMSIPVSISLHSRAMFWQLF
ncbi:hypothetical protein AVEN_134256-1 [Araneus ventricosus]|uniref:Uncharacterized protein n=1 Tax=Araneus ventricosus TaxID=182803 RepID=A0A4Y2MB26_ARAVE|nr:hypothetical protein AVEN_134256-1 [Araneus ventricosus]